MERVKEIHGSHSRGCRRFNLKLFESHRKSFGERPKRYWLETCFYSARVDWLDCELSIQSHRPSRRVSGRAHLAAYSRRGGVFVRKIFKESAVAYRQAVKSKADNPNTPTMTAVLLTSCCGVLSGTLGSIFCAVGCCAF